MFWSLALPLALLFLFPELVSVDVIGGWLLLFMPDSPGYMMLVGIRSSSVARGPGRTRTLQQGKS
jgi:hypothetical protein